MEPISNVRRYYAKDNRFVQAPQSYIIGEHNRSMGGMNRLDENVFLYRIQIKNQKWYWALL